MTSDNSLLNILTRNIHDKIIFAVMILCPAQSFRGKTSKRIELKVHSKNSKARLRASRTGGINGAYHLSRESLLIQNMELGLQKPLGE